MTNLHCDRTSVEGSAEHGSKHGPDAMVSAADMQIHRRISMAERLNTTTSEDGEKKSNMDRLNYILEEPSYRSLFRDFLKSNFCEENLSFWLDVEDFKRKFNITSSAQANASPVSVSSSPFGRPARSTPGQAAMERHHESLIQTALQIYHKYLAPSSQHELNIDHGLRQDLAVYLGEVMAHLSNTHGKGNGGSAGGQGGAAQATIFNATQLQMLIKLYSRIQTHVLRLMATDSLPKVCCTWIHCVHD